MAHRITSSRVSPSSVHVLYIQSTNLEAIKSLV